MIYKKTKKYNEFLNFLLQSNFNKKTPYQNLEKISNQNIFKNN